jgi:hypothetical protein
MTVTNKGIPRIVWEKVYNSCWPKIASYLTPKEQKIAGIPKTIRKLADDTHKQIMELDNNAILKKKLLALHKSHPEWTKREAAQVALKALHTFLSSYHIKPLSIAEKSYVAGRILERKALDLIDFFKRFVTKLIPEAATFFQTLALLNPIQKAKEITKWLEENKNHPQFSLPIEEMSQIIGPLEAPEEIRDLPAELSIIFGSLPEQLQIEILNEIGNKKNIALLKKLVDAYPENLEVVTLTILLAIDLARYDLMNKVLKPPITPERRELLTNHLITCAHKRKDRMFRLLERHIKDQIPQISEGEFKAIFGLGHEIDGITRQLIKWPQYKNLSQKIFNVYLVLTNMNNHMLKDPRIEQINYWTVQRLKDTLSPDKRKQLFRLPAVQRIIRDSLAQNAEIFLNETEISRLEAQTQILRILNGILILLIIAAATPLLLERFSR